MPSTTSPLDALDSAIRDVKKLLDELDAEERAIRDKRASIQSKLSAITGLSTTPAAKALPSNRPIVAIGQDSLLHRIARYLREHPRSKVGTIAKDLRTSSRKTKDALNRLRETGTVSSSGNARGTNYSLAAR